MKGIEQRLNDIEKRLDIIENSTREKNLEIARDELWNEFVKIIKLQDRERKSKKNLRQS